MDANELKATLEAWSAEHDAFPPRQLLINNEVLFELFWHLRAGMRGYITVYPEPNGMLVVQHGTEENGGRNTGGVNHWRCSGRALMEQLSKLKETVDQANANRAQRRTWVQTSSPRIESVNELKFS
jgi:hypothetical protein